MSSVIKFSANLGFLWTEHALPDAIVLAAANGFDAVECHMPYAYAPEDVRAALDETGLDMISMNTEIGENEGDFGLAAVPGREAEALAAIERAIEYSVAIGCRQVSVLAGITGRTNEAENTYRANLSYAAELAAVHDRRILIEPLNTGMHRDYHLVSADRGVETIEAVGADNLRLMVDCFHSRTMDGELLPLLHRVMPFVGHVQISAYPDRSEPVDGQIVYSDLLPWLVDHGYSGMFGAEYTPRGDLAGGLTWLRPWHEQRDAGEA